MDSAWPMFQHDAQHTGRTDVILPSGNQGVLKWRYLLYESDIPNNIKESTPVIDNNGVTYTGDFFHYLYAVYPNGTMKWGCKLDGGTERTGAIAEDGTIYFGVGAGRLCAVHPNGTIKWTIQLTERDLESCPTISPDGTIYIGCDGNKTLFAVNPDGTIKWSYKTGGSLRSPALDTQGNVYIGSGDGFFYCFYPNGTLRWKTEFGFVCGGQGPVIDDDTVYFTTGGSLYAMFNGNGTVKWIYDSGYWSSSGSPAVGFNGELYYGCGINGTNESGVFLCINHNGTLRWTYSIKEYCIASPAVTGGGVVIVGDHAGYVYAFSNEGELLWRYFTSKPIYSSFSIADDGSIYFTSWDGYLYSLEVVEHENHPPDTPTITGPSSGKAGEEYEYMFSSVDPDGDAVQFYIEWGDGNSEWTGFNSSGDYFIISHIWNEKDTYIIRAKTKDSNNAESDWATLEISMPKIHSYNPIIQLILKIIEIFHLDNFINLPY